MTWQPIETAPRDQTPVLVFDRGLGIVIAAWLGGRWLRKDADRVWATPSQLVVPTRWAPLPEPPEGP
jgi:hypothetical protein